MISALVRAILEVPFWMRWLELIEFVKDTGFGGNCQLN